MIFETCAVGGHDIHGKVERTIKSVQEGLETMGLSKMRLPAMGVQTLCKQIENSYNNLPLGYRYDRSQDNTEVLKMLVPNMLRTGRINSRALEGPVRLSNDNRKMLNKVKEIKHRPSKTQMTKLDWEPTTDAPVHKYSLNKVRMGD